MSLSQLMKVPAGKDGASLVTSTGPELQVWPFGIAVSQVESTGMTKIYQPSVSWYDYIMPAFAMSRGGMRIKFLTFQHAVGLIVAKQYPINQNTTVASVSRIGYPSDYFDFGGPVDFNGLLSQWFDGTSQIAEVQIAQYGLMHSRVNSELVVAHTTLPSFNNANQTPTMPTNFLGVQYKDQNIQDNAITILRSVSDDFQVGYFIGVPPLWRYSL